MTLTLVRFLRRKLRGGCKPQWETEAYKRGWAWASDCTHIPTHHHLSLLAHPAIGAPHPSHSSQQAPVARRVCVSTPPRLLPLFDFGWWMPHAHGWQSAPTLTLGLPGGAPQNQGCGTEHHLAFKAESCIFRGSPILPLVPAWLDRMLILALLDWAVH